MTSEGARKESDGTNRPGPERNPGRRSGLNGDVDPDVEPIDPASITLAMLEQRPGPILQALQRDQPVVFVPALDAWLVTGREEAVEAMRDADRFTVDDPRFSTAVVLGPSMLSLDGDEHGRHRGAFAPHFRPMAVRDGFDDWLDRRAAELVARFAGDGEAELRTALAGPLAVDTIARFLGLEGVGSADVLGWYRHLADAIVGVSVGEPVSTEARRAVAQIQDRVDEALADRGHPSLIRRIADGGALHADELGPSVAVLMFGAIETSEGMTANVLWHLLSRPALLDRVRLDRSLLPAVVEESLRLEPAAAVVDRYTTGRVQLGGVTIPAGDLVTISLAGANLDPATFEHPTRFDIDRPNLRQHVTFVQGPHGCLGLHLARAETIAAVHAVLDACPDVAFDRERSSDPSGLIFRKPASLVATWAT